MNPEDGMNKTHILPETSERAKKTATEEESEKKKNFLPARVHLEEEEIDENVMSLSDRVHVVIGKTGRAIDVLYTYWCTFGGCSSVPVQSFTIQSLYSNHALCFVIYLLFIGHSPSNPDQDYGYGTADVGDTLASGFSCSEAANTGSSARTGDIGRCTITALPFLLMVRETSFL